MACIQTRSIKVKMISLFRSSVVLLLVFIGLSTAYTQTTTVRINEFMALNSATLKDSDGVYSDWIEIYNPSTSGVNLQN